MKALTLVTCLAAFLAAAQTGCSGRTDGTRTRAANGTDDPGALNQPSEGRDTTALSGTAWRLEALTAAGVEDGVEATLEFMEEGRIGGNASCNHFFGSVEVSGDSIRFGELGSTKMACAEAVNDQEQRYLRALEEADRFEINEPFLLIYVGGNEEPLRFIRIQN